MFATGQKVLSETSFAAFPNIYPVDMSGVKKKSYITLGKVLMQKGLLKFPMGIRGLNHQFLNYELPDEKLPQDIVATFLVLFGLFWFMGFNDDVEMPVQETNEWDNLFVDRNARPQVDRNTRLNQRY